MAMKLSLVLDKSQTMPLYRQIAIALREVIRSEEVAPGVKLPSTREIAKQLDVHRRTVVSAFHLLEEEGLLTSRVGQGTFVSERAETQEAGTRSDSKPAPFSWETVLRRPSNVLPEFQRFWTRGQSTPDMIRFTGATADPSLFPTEDFRVIVDEVFRTHGASALDYGPTEGFLPLREWVAERLGQRGVVVSPEEVVIVTGSQQGLDLISRLLLNEGDVAVVEEPGYTSGFRLFQANGARTIGVPLDEGGLRCEMLEQICQRTQPRFLYMMPIFQNPTGLCLAPERVGPLLELSARYRFPMIEDQFDADLYYEEPPMAPVKAGDRDGRVVLLGSFSKILFPGLRLGWIVVPPPLAGPLRELKQMADFSSGLLAQYAMNLYCRRGLLDLHLERVRRIYGGRLRRMMKALEAEFPPEVRWTRPKGGLTLWVTLPSGVDSLELLQQTRREGVDFSPGPFFFPNGGGASYLRLSYIRETEERIGRGIAVLGQLLKRSLTLAEPVPAGGPPV
jgi:2-aminoadipate transaminase